MLPEPTPTPPTTTVVSETPEEMASVSEITLTRVSEAEKSFALTQAAHDSKGLLLQDVTSTGVAAALISGFALDQIDWMPMDGWGFASSILFYVSTHAGLLSAVLASMLYSDIIRLKDAEIVPFQKKFVTRLKLPLWLFLTAASCYLFAMALSTFMARGTPYGTVLIAVGLTTSAITVLCMAAFACSLKETYRSL